MAGLQKEDDRATEGLNIGMLGIFLLFLQMKEKMSIKTADIQKICPFTLEPFKDCVIREASEKRKCPFTLEPCFQPIIINFQKLSNVRTYKGYT